MSSKFLKPLAVAAIVLCALTVRPALASVITLDLADIDTFGQIGQSTGANAKTEVFESWLQADKITAFTTSFKNDPPAEHYVEVGVTNLNYDWNAYDRFVLDILNRNENNWIFQVFVRDHSKVASSAAISLVPVKNGGKWQSFTVDLQGINRSEIKEVVVRVGASSIPINGNDRTAEYAIRPVPEPASVLMLGTGLAMLGFVAGWRKKV